jgi:hypothetical protein
MIISQQDTAMESDNQAYSILIIFTNGNVHSVDETVAALDEVKDEPLSIVLVGLGPSDFSDMPFLNERQGNGDRVQFVDMKAHQDRDDALTEETLKEIPQQLVSYFVSKEIRPNPPVETDEIMIEPFNEEEEVKADIVISESGDIQIETDAKPPAADDGNNEEPSKLRIFGGKAKAMVMPMLMQQGKKQFGRVKMNMQRKFDRMVNTKVNETFGITPVKKKPAKKKPVKGRR